MKKERFIPISICAIIFLGFVVYQRNATHSEYSHKSEVSEKTTSPVSPSSLVYYDTQKRIESRLMAEMSTDIEDYMASTGNGLSVLVKNDNTLDVMVRVAILPDAIPMVADNLCPIIGSLADENGISSYKISFRYYSESNADGIDKNSFCEWHTNDGIKGTFVDPSGFYQMTLDELFSHYNNFGRTQD